MHALSLTVCAVCACAVVPVVVALLRRFGSVRANYRGVNAAFPGGLAVCAAAAVSVGALAAVAQIGETNPVFAKTRFGLVYVFGVCALGLIDDLLGHRPLVTRRKRGGCARPPRGLRGHARALCQGRLSTGCVKAVGCLALALYVLHSVELSTARYLLCAVLLTLSTHVFNLLDLRPGRAVKHLLSSAAAVEAASRKIEPVLALCPVLFALSIWLLFDLSERAMLGDTGAAVVGAVFGLMCVFSLGIGAQALVLAVLCLVAVYGEFRSLSALIERTPLLRRLDSLGRAHA